MPTTIDNGSMSEPVDIEAQTNEAAGSGGAHVGASTSTTSTASAASAREAAGSGGAHMGASTSTPSAASARAAGSGGAHMGPSTSSPSAGSARAARPSLFLSNSWLFTMVARQDSSLPADEETDLITVAATRVSQREAELPHFMFSPSAWWRFWWDCALHTLILIQIVLIPFELAFLEEALMHTHVICLLFEVLVVNVFFADMVLNFRTGLWKYGRLNYDPRQVALSYARGSFGLDLLAWLPCLLGLVFVEQEETDLDDGRTTALARASRTFRFFRIFQIVRVFRLQAVAGQLHLKLLESPAIMNPARGVLMFLTITLCMHFTACLWASIALDSHIESTGRIDLESSIFARYVFGLWWASCSLTVGGQPAPNSTAETVLAFFVNMISAFLMGSIITWCFTLYTSANEAKSSLVLSMKAASRFADMHGLEKELREEMRNAIHQNQHRKQVRHDFRELAEDSLSESLRKRIYGSVYNDALRRFPAFSERAPSLYPGCMAVNQEFLWQLAYGSQIASFLAEERVVSFGEPARTMGFVIDGCLLVMGPLLPRPRILRQHAWFGEKVVIFDNLRRNKGGNTFFVNAMPTRAASIVAVQCSTLLVIDKDVFINAVREHDLGRNWLGPIVEQVKMKRRTLGCSCCGDVFHTVSTCPHPAAQPEDVPEHFLKMPSPASTKYPPRPRWLATQGPGNNNVPPDKWGMKLEQWAAFIMTCCFTEIRDELERDVKQKDAGHVNLYQINERMVKPWTTNTGSSVALLMNSKAPLKADVMISHSWAESVLETLVSVLGKASVTGMKMDTVVWFCTFSQYQAGNMEGDCGPTVAEQLEWDPFARVIESKPPHGMLVVHTSTAELYSRLWCVFEISQALETGLPTIPAYSMGALQRLFGTETGAAAAAAAGRPRPSPPGSHPKSPGGAKRRTRLERAVAVDTSTAICGSKTDTDMIRSKVHDAGGFDVLNKKIVDFRMDSVEEFERMFTSFTEWAAGDDSHNEVFEGLMEVVSKAGIFVGLRCLLPYARQAQDEQLVEDIEELAKDILELWQEAFEGFEKLPPGLQAADMPSAWEHVRDCLRDETKAPVATKLLQMSAGGVDKNNMLYSGDVVVDKKDPMTTNDVRMYEKSSVVSLDYEAFDIPSESKLDYLPIDFVRDGAAASAPSESSTTSTSTSAFSYYGPLTRASAALPVLEL